MADFAQQRWTRRTLAVVAGLLSVAAYCYAFPGLRRIFYTAGGWRILREGVIEWVRAVVEHPVVSGMVILCASAVIYSGIRLMRR